MSLESAIKIIKRKQSKMTHYNLSEYDYHLPPELIAQEPLKQRDASKMMVLHRAEKIIESKKFEMFTSYLKEGDLLVLNDTRVIPARLIGTVEGKNKEAELLLLRKLQDQQWVCMVKPGRHLKPGSAVLLNEGVRAIITGYAEEGLRIAKFNVNEPLEYMLSRLGQVPLPPYIKKEVENPDQYQTVYARKSGSAAAPTAGFHFTDHTFNRLDEIGVEKTFITLHIGPGTFQPVKVEDIRDHVMHREYFSVNDEAENAINRVRLAGGRIIAVGTTVCRVLETIADQRGLVRGVDTSTDLYVYPGYKFKAVDAMLTNFHLPRSSLLMLVSALAGHDLIMKAYRQAVMEEYRFFSFGDCMLIL